jgi:hypothetical protein
VLDERILDDSSRGKQDGRMVTERGRSKTSSKGSKEIDVPLLLLCFVKEVCLCQR